MFFLKSKGAYKLIVAPVALMNLFFIASTTITQVYAYNPANVTTVYTESSTQTNSLFNESISQQLLKMNETAQQYRQKLLPYQGHKIPQHLLEEVQRTDNIHNEQLQDIINQIGWPTPQKVGVKAASAAFLLAEKAPLALKKQLLPTFKEQFKQGNLTGQQLAVFTDKLLIKEGKKQQYGTQLAIVNKEVIFNNIEDEKHVDQRRAAMGMISLSAYQALLEKMYHLK